MDKHWSHNSVHTGRERGSGDADFTSEEMLGYSTESINSQC